MDELEIACERKENKLLSRIEALNQAHRQALEEQKASARAEAGLFFGSLFKPFRGLEECGDRSSQAQKLQKSLEQKAFLLF